MSACSLAHHYAWLSEAIRQRLTKTVCLEYLMLIGHAFAYHSRLRSLVRNGKSMSAFWDISTEISLGEKHMYPDSVHFSKKWLKCSLGHVHDQSVLMSYNGELNKCSNSPHYKSNINVGLFFPVLLLLGHLFSVLLLLGHFFPVLLVAK